MLARSRLVLGLCGLALTAPALPAMAGSDDVLQAAGTAPAAGPSDGAQPPIVLEPEAGSRPWSGYEPSSAPQPSSGLKPSSVYQPPSGAKPMAAAAPAAAPAESKPHHHKGLFGWRHCVECQRARVKQHDGVEVPPPPGMPGMAVQGETVVTGPVVIMDAQGQEVNDPQSAGFAVVGPDSESSAAGVAVIGGAAPSAEPVPIGVARGGQNPWADPRMASMSRAPGAGSYDASVVPTSIPKAPEAMGGPGHDRPKIISHLFGLPMLGRHRREAEEQERRQHAAIAYGDSTQKVTEVPASVIYSGGGK